MLWRKAVFLNSQTEDIFKVYDICDFGVGVGESMICSMILVKCMDNIIFIKVMMWWGKALGCSDDEGPGEEKPHNQTNGFFTTLNLPSIYHLLTLCE